MTDRRNITIRFEGDSGDGIVSMGRIAARAAARLGYHVYTYSTFLAVVRGGQVTFQLRIGAEPLLSQGNDPDILVALNRQAVHDYGTTVRQGGICLHQRPGGAPDPIAPGATAVPIDFQEISSSETGSTRSKNIVAVGALFGMLGISDEMLGEVVRETFAKKSKDIINDNVVAMAAGYAEGEKVAASAAHLRFDPPELKHRMLISGNEAVALGALAAGVRFFAGYPITPASEIMEWLASELPKVGGTMLQVEDEIAALAMCIGASFGGVPAMTSTSGPGLSLMIELLGLAGMAEIPIVVVDVQRAGPSTGMPTKEAQGDLLQAAMGTHGEVPRVVLAPHTVAGCFYQTVHAVNIAHRFHIPVILLSSQSLSHRMQTIDPPDLKTLETYREPLYAGPESASATQPFMRYRENPEGLPSMRSVPGTEGGMYRTGGLEHDETGNPNFEPDVRRRMVERRRGRMRAIARAFQGQTLRSEDWSTETPLGLMSWGASASVAREAVQDLDAEGIHMRFLLPHVLWPMPDVAMRNFLGSGIKYLFVCELNATRQFAEMVKARYTRELVKYEVEVISITKDEGLPFTPSEIRQGILDALAERPWKQALEAAK